MGMCAVILAVTVDVPVLTAFIATSGDTSRVSGSVAFDGGSRLRRHVFGASFFVTGLDVDAAASGSVIGVSGLSGVA